MKINKVHCLFEQSGTFKNEFIKLGIPAEDYDILNDFKQTDNIIDIFDNINKAYDGKPSLFDNISKDDLIFAFFPCTRFEDQIILHYRQEAYQYRNKDDIDKLESCLVLQKELAMMYDLITKLAIICLRMGLRMIIENPYSQSHYLTRYWCLKPAKIDKDRREDGDYYKKPTQYWFINCEPLQNLLFEPIKPVKTKTIAHTRNQVERSMISKQYANRFIREFIIEDERNNYCGKNYINIYGDEIINE